MGEAAVPDTGARVLAAWTDILGEGDGSGATVEQALSFVTAGGHSLAAARLVARLRGELGVEIPLSALLRDDPTASEFVAVVVRLGAGAPVDPSPPVAATPPAARTAALPLAPTMRRIWAWHRLYPDSPAYNVSRVLRVEGRIRPAALRAAVADLAARHEALRCSVQEPRPGEPRIQVGDPAPVPVSVHVVADASGATVDEALYRIGAVPFPLDTAPLWRVGVVYVPAMGCSFVVLVIHHLISDLRSSDQVLREIALCYEARLEGRAHAFATAAPSLLEHVEHELGLVGAPQWSRDLDWWSEQLTGVGTASAAPLPFAAAYRDERVFAAETRTVDLDEDASAGVTRALRASGVTPAIFFLTAASAVVAAWAGGAAETVGIPSVRFSRPEDHDLVGFLLDTLPLRIAVARDETFEAACARTRDAYTDAADHAQPAFDDIVDRLRLPRTAGARSPLIRLWFNDMTRSDMPARFGDLASGEYDLPPAWSLFELGIYLHRRDRHRYRLHVVVPHGLYPGADVAELLAQIVRLVERAAAEPTRTVAELLAADAARSPVVGGERPGGGVLEHLARHAEARPTAPAVSDAEGELDHRELDRLVQAEAAVLLDAAGPRSVVAVPAHHDRRFVVRLLACRRAGVTAVLVDTAWPDRRRARAAEIAGVTHAYPDGDRPITATGRPVPEVDPGAGHVLFTSGTTGDPLAVRVSSAVADAAVADLVELLHVSADDRVSMLSGAAHDPVLRDIGLALHTGATLCIPPPGTPADPRLVASWLRRERVSVVDATPALLGLALGTEDEPLPDLRTVVCGGSVLSTRTAALVRTVAPRAVLVNGYGCTETPQLVAAHVLATDSELPETVQVPIGVPLPGRRIEIRATDGRPCAPGQLGELWVAAPHIAEGYLGADPPARFVVDEAGTSWVRTGDLGRHDAAGLIHLAGRADRQVLLGGHRVTLDEIENAARSCAGVADALAQVVGDGDDRGTRLWAQRAPGSALAAETVRAHLAALLPPGAVPARVLVMDRLELGATMKVAAPEPPPTSGDVDAELKRLAESMLGRSLDRTTNFFDAGFTSMTLVQLSAELSELLRRPVEALAVFQHPNLGALGAYLHRPRGEFPRLRAPGGPAQPGHGRVRAQDRRREIRARIRGSMPGNPVPPS